MSIREHEHATARRRSRTSRSALAIWTIPVMLLAPLGLGAKGCGAAVVGDDCAEDGSGENCAGAGGGSNTGGKSAQGGQAAKGGAPALGGAPSKGGASGSGGATSKSCGSFAGEQCAADEYCAYPLEAQCGAADHPGTCTPIPDVCRDIYQPVCGCDGKDYANECEAAGVSVSVAKLGKCGDPGGVTCGGLAGIACKDGEFCNYPPAALCGAADQTGVCAPVPQACDAIYKPVCGCDGATHPSACMANLKSISVAAEGECGGAVVVCGGDKPQSCASGTYCNYAPDARCGEADQTGVCATQPMACTKEYVPVCGCDGKTYGNRCEAARNGTSVRSDGACQ